MSSDSSEASGSTKVYKLRSKKYFPIWKQKALSTASSRGYNKYLTQDVTVKTETEIDTMETNYINETDDAKRRKMKGELSKYKRERKRSLEAADMLVSYARSKDLKMLSACKSDPKKMFDKLCKKYGTEEDTDLTDLLEDFKTCKLRSKKRDPEYWFAELDEINEQLGGIDVSISKNNKEIAAHIVSNLPKGYKSVKTVIELGDDYLDDLSRIKNMIIKKYKTSHKKKTRRSKYSSDSESSSEDSSSSSDDSSRYERKSRRNRDKLALNVNEEKKDTRNQYGIIICGHCRKPGHGMATCWELHGRPTNFQNRNNNQAIRGRRKCWNCGSTEHLAHQCPNVNGNNNEGNNVQDEDEDHINSLFIGTMVHCKMDQEFRPKVRLNAYEMRYGKENPNVINDDNSWYDIGDNNDNDGNASDSSRSMSWYDICEEEEASSDEESIITNPSRKYKSDKEIARELKRLLGIDDEDEDEKIPHPNDFEDAPFVGMIRVADDDSDEEIDHSHNTTGQVRQQHVDQSDDDESNAEHIQEEENSTQHHNTVREEEMQPPSRFVGPTYYRDPYETDTDQSVGCRDSDFEAGRDPMTNDRTMREVQMGFETWLASAIEGSRIGSNDENTEAKNDKNTAEYIDDRRVTRRRNEDSDDDNNNEQDSKNCNAIFVEDELNLVEEDDEWESWLADTGASCHVTNNDDCLHNKRSTHKDAIIVGDQRKCRVTQKGMLKLRAKENDETIHLDNVRVVKTIGKNIISISALMKQGGTMYGNENRITINYDDKTLTFIRNMIDGLYYTKMKRLHSTTKDYCNAITTSSSESQSRISKPIARRTRSTFSVQSKRKSKVPVPTITTKRTHKKPPSKQAQSTSSQKSSQSHLKLRSGTKVKRVIGDTVAKRVRIFTNSDEGEEMPNVHHVDEDNDEESTELDLNIMQLSDKVVERLQQGIDSDDETILQLYTMELINDTNTPTTIRQALSCEDQALWKKSAIAEVNNFLKRKSWKFILKSVVLALGRKLIGVKWVFKIKNEADYSQRYKSRVVSKGYMQIPGVDYTEKNLSRRTTKLSEGDISNGTMVILEL